jgi:hypothetical protein
MVPGVAFDNLVHQAVDGPASGSDELQHVRALLVCIQCFFNSFDLATDSSHPGQKLPLTVVDELRQTW